MNITSVDYLSEAIGDMLGQYNREVVEATKKETEKAMNRLVRETKATAPRRRPKYFKNITSKKDWENAFGSQYTWYVKGEDYRLTHLLEFGHALRNGGRTTGTHFVKNASDSVIRDYISAVEEVLRNG